MFEIISNDGRYADFVIARRSINCLEVTRDEFIKALIEDGKDAIKSYNENAVPRITEITIKRNAEYEAKRRENTISRAIAYAERKWKTEKRRNQYIQEVIAQLDSEVKEYIPSVRGIGFFDMDGNCGTQMGINITCTLAETAFDNPERIGVCYDTLQKSQYFKKAIGWQFMYDGDTETYRSAFRPKIKLLFDEATTKEIEKNVEALNKAVADFYRNSTYCGD